LVDLEARGWPNPLGEKKYDFLQNSRENEILEHHEPDRREFFEEITANLCRIIHCQEFGRKNKTKPSTRPNKVSGMYNKRRPSACQSIKPDTLGDGGPQPLSSSISVKILVTDVRRIPYDNIILLSRLNIKEIRDSYFGIPPSISKNPLCRRCRRCVKFDAVEMVSGSIIAPFEYP
jgi:hypothetical protein